MKENPFKIGKRFSFGKRKVRNFKVVGFSTRAKNNSVRAVETNGPDRGRPWGFSVREVKTALAS